MKTKLFFSVLFSTCFFIGCNEKPIVPKISSVLQVYPNPAIEMAMITVRNTVTTSFELEVYDVKGKIMMKENVLPGSHDIKIDLNGKPKGRYHVILVTDKEILMQHLTKI